MAETRFRWLKGNGGYHPRHSTCMPSCLHYCIVATHHSRRPAANLCSNLSQTTGRPANQTRYLVPSTRGLVSRPISADLGCLTRKRNGRPGIEL